MPAQRGDTKRSAGLSQPTLSFKSRKPSTTNSPSKTKTKTKSRASAARGTRGAAPASASASASPSPAPARERSGSDSPTPLDPPSPSPARPLSKSKKALALGARVTAENDQEEERHLDVRSKAVKTLMKDARKEMGGLEPIHAGPDTHNDVHHILRVFDMTASYGPCVGVSRLQRWERAKRWGLAPPDEIRDILTTVEGRQDVSYRENVLHQWV